MKHKKVKLKSIIITIIAIIVTTLLFIPDILQSKNSIFYNKEGWGYLNRGDNFRAIISFKNALKKNSKYKEALTGLGKAYIKTEAFDESLKLFNDVLKIDKKNSEAINGIGFAMVALGRNNDALMYFGKTLKLYEDNIEAKYGIAYIYFLMNRIIWSKRKLETILKVNPFHYNSLLLMADIKSRENKPEEAKIFIQKAIDANSELPDGYLNYGQILLKEYKRSYNIEYLNEAVDKFNRALSIHPENIFANRNMGNIALIKKNYNEAIKYMEKALTNFPKNEISLYNLAIAYLKMGNNSKAIYYFSKALKISPSDSMLISRLEDFLVLEDYAFGHPLRVKFSREHYDMALDKQKNNLPNDAVAYFQRSLLLNPLNRLARESLRDNYLTLNYYRFFVDEQKTLYKIYSENKYQDRLLLAIIKRRDKLYHKSGYSTELPPRDVPVILVLNFDPMNTLTPRPDAGEVIANYLTFSMSHFGRTRPVGVKKRLNIVKELHENNKRLGDNLEKIGDMIKSNHIKNLDYIIYGDYREGFTSISLNFEILNFHTGVIIDNFTLSENGKNNLANLSLRAAKKIYDAIPYRGRVLQTNKDHIIVNLGLFDGIKKNDLLMIYKYKSPDNQKKLSIKKKLMFVVNESDTFLSSAKPKLISNLKHIDINDHIYPYKKIRARLIR